MLREKVTLLVQYYDTMHLDHFQSTVSLPQIEENQRWKVAQPLDEFHELKSGKPF